LITSKCTYPPPPPSLPPSSPSSSSPIIFNTNNNPKQAHGRKLLRPHPLDQSCVAPAQEARQGRKGRRAHRQHQLDQWALAGFAFESWYVACFFSVLMDISSFDCLLLSTLLVCFSTHLLRTLLPSLPSLPPSLQPTAPPNTPPKPGPTPSAKKCVVSTSRSRWSTLLGTQPVVPCPLKISSWRAFGRRLPRCKRTMEKNTCWRRLKRRIRADSGLPGRLIQRGMEGEKGGEGRKLTRLTVKQITCFLSRLCQVFSPLPFSFSSLFYTHPHNKQPENVGRVMLWAVTAEKYRPQYLVGMDARFVNMPFLALPRRYAGTAG